MTEFEFLYLFYLPINAPHSPFRVAEQYREPYREEVGEDLELSKFYGMIANIDETMKTVDRAGRIT